MRRCVMIADDITGCNATGILLGKQGFRVVSLLDGSADVDLNQFTQTDALMWNSATRLLPPSEAARGVGDMTKRASMALGGSRSPNSTSTTPLIAKRIDSTLRGPVGQELAAMLEVLPHAIAAVVPAFPASGRVAIDGIVYVHGVPVSETEAGRDKVTPVHTSNIVELLSTQASQPVVLVRTHQFPVFDALVDAISAEVRRGVRIVVCDAKSDEDVILLAEAWTRVEQECALGVVLPVDPGPFTAAFTAAFVTKRSSVEASDPLSVTPSQTTTAQASPSQPLPSRTGQRQTSTSEPSPSHMSPSTAHASPSGVDGPILVISGSLMPSASAQVDALERTLPTSIVPVEVGRLLDADEDGASEYRKGILNQLQGAAAKGLIVGIRTDCDLSDADPNSKSNVSQLPASRSTIPDPAAIANAIAEFAAELLVAIQPSGLYLSGGEIAARVLQRIEVSALHLIGEVLPLCALTQAVGGSHDGLRVVTKGGAVGDEQAIVTSVHALRHGLNSNR